MVKVEIKTLENKNSEVSITSWICQRSMKVGCVFLLYAEYDIIDYKNSKESNLLSQFQNDNISKQFKG